jgi:periplasmic protein TonB
MKKILPVLFFFIAANTFAQKLKDIPPAPPPPPIVVSNDKDVVFQKVEVEAAFPGGREAWIKFLQKNLKTNVPAKNGAPVGTYTVIVRFLVEKDGKISEVVIETDPGYGTGEEAIRVIKKSPKWKHGMQNGVPVGSIKRQPISFLVERN